MVFIHTFYKKVIRSVGRIIFLYTCLFLFYPLSAQTYFFDSYGPEQGLESSKIYSVRQVKDDNIWLGTSAGLSKFDGISFTNYTVENGLAEGGVTAIFEDSFENVWLGHLGGGLTLFDGKNFNRVEIPDSVLSNDITSIIQDRQKKIWITTYGDGTIAITDTNENVKEPGYIQYKGKGMSDRVFSSIITSDNIHYFITDVGIKQFMPDSNKFINYARDGFSTFFTTTCMFEDSKKNLWFGTYNGGLIKYDYGKDSFIIYDDKDGIATNWISAITEDKNGNIWFGHWDKYDKGGLTR